MKDLTKNTFMSMTEDELQNINAGSPGLVVAIIGVCIAGYGLLRQAVKDKGKADALRR